MTAPDAITHCDMRHREDKKEEPFPLLDPRERSNPLIVLSGSYKFKLNFEKKRTSFVSSFLSLHVGRTRSASPSLPKSDMHPSVRLWNTEDSFSIVGQSFVSFLVFGGSC